MFSIFKKKKFSCIGVNPYADWSKMDSIITPLELHQYLKTKSYTKEEIKQLQIKLHEKGLPYDDLLKQLNWVSEKQESSINVNSATLIQVISGVRSEFENSEPHNEIYERHIAPSIIKSLSSETSFLKYDIENVEHYYLQKGVMVPLHFDRYLLIKSEIAEPKSETIFVNLEIKEKLPAFSLESNIFQDIETLIDSISIKVKTKDASIDTDIDRLIKILDSNEQIKGKYAQINGYFAIGVALLKIGQQEKSEKFFEMLLKLQSDISPLTIAKDFLRPIGEMFETRKQFKLALFWYQKAIELSPNIGLKKKIKELETNN